VRYSQSSPPGEAAGEGGKEDEVTKDTKPKRRAASLLKGFEARSVPESEYQTFYTKGGRVVRDGGGIEADIKVDAPQASVLEVSLQQQGMFFDFANEWAKTHTYVLGEGLGEEGPSLVTDATYEDFKQFVKKKEKEGNFRMDLLFSGSLEPLQEALTVTTYDNAEKELEGLREAVREEVMNEFVTEKKQIKEEVGQAILARYLPESVLRRLALEGDPQVKAAIEAVKEGGREEGREGGIGNKYWQVLKGRGGGGRKEGGGREGGKKGEVVAAMEKEVYEKERKLRLNGKVVWYGGSEGGREEKGRHGRAHQNSEQEPQILRKQQQQQQQQQPPRWVSPSSSRRSSAPPSSPAARVPVGMDRAWS